MDTTNILFICGGAFVGLEKVVERRVGQKSLGFHTDAQPTTTNRRNFEVLEQAQPTDLIRYGLIPEFVGRLPVLGVLSDLDKSALMRILTEPKNALIRQYQRLFEFENVRLRFSEDALETVAMAQLNTARGYAESGDGSNATQSYARLLALWPHADAENPLVGEARAAVSR